jgi:hypothetical protein
MSLQTVLRSVCSRGRILRPHVAPIQSIITTRRPFTRAINLCQDDSKFSPQENEYKNDFVNISSKPFSKEALEVLQGGLDENDVEIKPDGILYLPEIKYRRILNKAFGPGGWALMPRGAFKQPADNFVMQEYALYCQGQFVSQAHGEQSYGIGNKSIATALEGAKSNALMRCCKDIGIASELWDPSFIHQWRSKYAIEVWCTNQKTNQKKKLYRRKDRPEIAYPWKEGEAVKASSAPVVEEAQESGDEKPIVKKTKKVITPTGEYDKEEPVVVGEPDMFDGTVMGEDDDEPTPKKKVKFDPKSVIAFGKHKGTTWEDFYKKSEKEFNSYIKYLQQKNFQPAFIQAVSEYFNKRA